MMNHFGEIQSAEPRPEVNGGLESGALTQAPTIEQLDEQLRIHEYERQRMGQELHDCAGQLLVSLQLSIAHLAEARASAEHDNVLDEMRQTVSEIDREIRSLAFLHYPAELGERGICTAVQSLVSGFARRTGIRATFKCAGDGTGLADPIAMAMLRVVQEALVNVHRHAHASYAKVLLERRPDELRLTIADDGVGISVAQVGAARGIGLQGMRHRMEALGGRFHIRNLKHGTSITASVPLAV